MFSKKERRKLGIFFVQTHHDETGMFNITGMEDGSILICFSHKEFGGLNGYSILDNKRGKGSTILTKNLSNSPNKSYSASSILTVLVLNFGLTD